MDAEKKIIHIDPDRLLSAGHGQSFSTTPSWSWPKPGDRMVFINKYGNEKERAEAAHVFQEGVEYTVENCEVNSSSHYIEFAEIPRMWNGVMFQVSYRCQVDLAAAEPEQLLKLLGDAGQSYRQPLWARIRLLRRLLAPVGRGLSRYRAAVYRRPARGLALFLRRLYPTLDLAKETTVNTRLDGCIVLRPVRDLGADFTSRDLETALLEGLGQQQRAVVIDLSEVHNISGMALHALLAAWKRREGSRLAIAGPLYSRVGARLQQSCIDQLVPIFPSVEAAIASPAAGRTPVRAG